ncbi:MAG TPA: hypothetical protein VKK61_05285 [Tepidisphaeraceae bacterium]|jgi:hypothetical protein|nr:hypothetical protein [Tepidisphaeraceae bacterium]
MKLLKLVIYAGFGYLVYELVQGWMHGSSIGREAESRDLHRALNEDAGRMNMTGPAVGMPVEVADSVGGHSQRRVGRGVVRT